MNITKPIVIISSILGLGAIGYGLYKFIASQLVGAMNFCYKIAGFKFITLNKNLIQLKIDIKLLQNSDVRLTLKKYDLDIFINGVKAANINESKNLDILPKAVSYLTAGVTIYPKKVFKETFLGDLIYNAVMDKSKVVVEIKGTLKAVATFIPISFPIAIKMNLAELTAPTTPTISNNKQAECKIY